MLVLFVVVDRLSSMFGADVVENHEMSITRAFWPNNTYIRGTTSFAQVGKSSSDVITPVISYFIIFRTFIAILSALGPSFDHRVYLRLIENWEPISIQHPWAKALGR